MAHIPNAYIEDFDLEKIKNEPIPQLPEITVRLNSIRENTKSDESLIDKSKLYEDETENSSQLSRSNSITDDLVQNRKSIKL